MNGRVHYLVVPTFDGSGRCMFLKDWTMLGEHLTALFGSYTCIECGEGGWMAPDGKPITEAVKLYMCVAPICTSSDEKEAWRHLLLWIKDLWKQQTVLSWNIPCNMELFEGLTPEVPGKVAQ